MHASRLDTSPSAVSATPQTPPACPCKLANRLASMNLLRSVVEIVVIGVVSAGGGYVLGTVVPHLLGY